MKQKVQETLPAADSESIASNQGYITFDDAYIQRLRDGDHETATHFDLHFRRLLRAKVWGRYSWQQQQDLVDDTIATAIQNIMQSQLRDARCLSAYVRNICSNLEKHCCRPDIITSSEEIDRFADGAKSVEDRILQQETAKAVQRTLRSLRKKDRELLVDIYWLGLSRDEACAMRGVTHSQLKIMLFRAKQRFERNWRNRRDPPS